MCSHSRFITRQIILASTALLLATWSPAQVTIDLYKQALAQRQSGELAAARRSLEESIRASDDRWEKHRDLAQILLELGDLEAARAQLERAKSGLDNGRRTIADLEARFLARAESLLTEAKEDLAAGNTRRAGEKVAQIEASFPDLAGLREVRDAIPEEFLPQTAQMDERRSYVEARRRLLESAPKDIRSVSPKDLLDWIEDSITDASLDTAKKLLKADDPVRTEEGRKLIEAVYEREKSVDYELIYVQLEAAEREAAERGADTEPFFALAKQAATSPVYAPLVRRKLEVWQDREPPLVVEVLRITDAAGDGDSRRVLEGIWVRFADRLRPSLPALDEAARAGAWDRFIDLMAENGPVVDPEFEALRQLVRDGRASEASARLQAMLTRLQRLARGGALDFPLAIKGRTWVTGCGVPMRWIEPNQLTIPIVAPASGAKPAERLRSVKLTSGYWLAERRLTRREWLSMQLGPVWNVLDDTADDLDAEIDCHLTFGQAQAFCVLLTDADRKAGRLPDGYCYTLPTEAEYELACRAGTATAYWYGNERNDAAARDRANPYGIKGLHLGIWDMCLDASMSDQGHHGAEYGIDDPVGKHGPYRILRGANRSSDRKVLRGDASPHYFVNFRLALAYRPNI
jgi:hypothetical protein